MRLNYHLYFLIISCLSLLTGCTTKKENTIYNPYVDEKVVDEYNLMRDYDFSNAQKDGFVIIQENKVINEDKIDEFYKKTSNNEEATLTIVRYTLDQEEIVVQYVYKDESYTVYIDNTRDQSEEGKVHVRTIKDIEIGYDELGRKTIIEKY